MADIRDIGVVDGRFFTEQEDRSRAFVAVIGDTVRTTLFPGDASPLGQIVRIEGIEFTVIGVQERLGSAFGRDQDNSIYIPDHRLQPHVRSRATASRSSAGRRPGSGLDLEDALDETRVVLRTRFHARPGQPDNFDTLTPDAIRGFIDQLLGMVAAVVVPVTCISLVVGGIVIMNIMLVSVTERTREIGIRKALGARHGDIMMQILIEAVVLASAGRRDRCGARRGCHDGAGQGLRTLAAHYAGLRGAVAGRFESDRAWSPAGIRRRARPNSIRWWRLRAE